MGAASLIASAATRSAIEGSSFGANIRAGLPDVIGQVLGRALVGAVQGGGGRSPGGVAGAVEAATEPELQQPGLSLELDTKANLRRATDSAFAMLNDLENANNRTYGGADLAAGAGNAPLGSGTGLPVSGPNQDGDASVIWIRRTHDYEPLPAQVLETERYYAVTKAVSEATQGNLAAHWEQWRHLSADRLQPLLQALVASEVPGARVLLGPDHINYLANPDNLTAPRFADYTYYEETSAYQQFMTRFSLTTIGSGVYGYFGVANAEMRATNPLSAAIGEYGQYAMGVVSLARAGIRTGVAETVEFAAESVPLRLTPQQVKAKIFGTAQSTGDNLVNGVNPHAMQSYREAILLARNPDIDAVFLNQGYNTGLGLAPRTISPNLRPDVLGRYFDGRVARIEVQSATDTRSLLIRRNLDLNPQIIQQGFTPLDPRVVLPRGR